MIDKKRIAKNFEKRIGEYEQNAYVQKKMAEKLTQILPSSSYKKILEIGSYSGVLTKELIKNIDFESYLALDIVENSKDYLENIDKKIIFKKADIEAFETNEKFDLIVSNAALQWCSDFEGTIKKLKSFLNPKGVLAISIFSPQNLQEIRETFNISLSYPDENLLNKHFSTISSGEIKINFESPLDILRHLKYTGVNSLTSTPLTFKEIKNNLNRLEAKYGNTLTYTPVYLVFQNQK